LKEANALVEELRTKVDENSANLSHYEKMKEQRDSLEERISRCQKAASELALIEDELKLCKDSKKKLESELSYSNESCGKLKTELDEARGEVIVLKQATKTAAKDAQEAHEYRIKNDELTRELERLNSVLDASQRENDALDVLKTELVSKGNEISNIQEKLQHLHTELGAKNREVSQFIEKNQVLQAEVDAKEYDLVKIKDERDKLMEHYEMLFKKKQSEIENMKSKEREKSSLGEIMARATPSKLTGDLKEKLSRAEEELAICKEKLVKEEDLTSELKNELNSLQKQMDTKVAQYEREVNRTKLANQKVIAEFKETNKQLQKRLDSPSVSSLHEQDSPTLEADDSKTDTSMIENTPVVKKGKGRARGRNIRGKSSTASLASFEDSNTENEPDVTRPRTTSVSRKGRVTRKTSKPDLSLQEENERSTSRKRPSTTRSESGILKEKQSFMLSPVPEGEKSGNRSSDFTLATTPGVKKKRKLYSMTPQHSEVFTPPTDIEGSTPGSVVKRQLRTRSQSKK